MPREPAREDPNQVALQRESWRKAQARDAEKYAEMARLSAEREANRFAARASRRAERDDAYRAAGIEPGPLAWFKALPEVTQAILLGLAFAAPAAAMAIVFFAGKFVAH